MELRLADMHCHLDRMSDPIDVARQTATAGIFMLDTTVTPLEALLAQRVVGHEPNVRVGVGMHPWWISNGSCNAADVDLLVEQAEDTPFIGEIGLDFGARHGHAAELQLEVFRRVVAAIASHPLSSRVLSIHAVQSAGHALNILERFDLVGPRRPAGTACIFHWFSGTSNELTRARRLGCYFSINERMLASKRGREYARAIPVNQLLLETDAPPELDTPYSASELEASLTRAFHTLAELRRVDTQELREAIARTSARLLG